MSQWLAMSFWVPGKAAPQGSKRHVGHGRMVEASKEVGPWRERVALEISRDMRAHDCSPVAPKEPVRVQMRFLLPRLASAPKTRPHPPATTKPDLDKLVRAVLDALTGPVLHDDAQVIDISTTKERAALDGEPGVHITVERLAHP